MLTYAEIESYEDPKDQGVARSWSGSSGSDENYSPPKTRGNELRSQRPVRTRLDSASFQTDTANNENSPHNATSSASKSAHGQNVPQIRLSGVENDWTPGTHPAEHKYYFAGPPSPLYEDGNDPFDMRADIPMDERTRLDSSTGVHSRDPQKPRFSLSDEDEILPAPRHSQMTQDDITRQSRTSQVVRKVNSGFEILRPGTLDRPLQTSDDVNPGQNLDVAGSSPTKKLHKKNRDSLSLRESRFTEGT